MKDTSDVGESIAIDLAQTVYEHLEALEKFTGKTQPKLRMDILAAAWDTVATLRRRIADQKGIDAAHNVCAVLFGDQDPPHDFWDSPLGVDVAWMIGYPRPQVPLAAAQRVMNMSRGLVWEYVNRRGVTLTPDGMRDYVRNSPRWMQRSHAMFS